MEIGTIIAIGVVVLVINVVFFLVLRSTIASNKGSEPASDGLMLIQQQMQDLSRMLDSKVGSMTAEMRESLTSQLTASQRLMRDTNETMVKHLTDVTKGVTEANEASKQVFTIAEQLQNLEKVLKNQKQRGNLGEMALELVLSNILPPSAYKLQYLFPGGDIVDAVVMTKDGFIPVDAKFSLDNYTRVTMEDDPARREVLEKDFKNDLKKRIDETAKYIRPQDGTLPFAFMFIPAEGIYYDLLINEVGAVKVNTRNLIDYAYKDKNVIIVSPTTFAAYLQSVLYGFRAFKIEESAKEIGKHVEELSRHMKAYDDYFKKVGNSLATTVNHYNAASKELGKIDKDVLKITGSRSGVEPSLLEKPVREEE
jgi:DNA recombination protein RmuC